MRALRVVGIHEDGKSIVCEDPARRERFILPADERLRAAARGDITRLGQIEIELESQMRPREIQARIRAGESVQQVADSAGVPEQRVERFAYPVLLERSRFAELAQAAHPVREDGPDVRTLGEVVAYGFGVRGQDYGSAEWDAWKGDDGKWVVALRWQTGRSDMAAHWSFAQGAHGGTVNALDEHAEDLLDPHRAPRTLRAVEPEPLPVAEPEPPAPVVEEPEAVAPEPPAEPEPKPAAPPKPAPPAKPAASAKPKSKKNHPAVPAWEDVLLGVRSQRG
ncbi:septation protein SepH [Amycolatopsis sp. GM8]|uniref:septation protein SepH n=1 Tax=Amycolatopsis sp. GM8 TaxID=2896530 RepID=UPI001EED19D6|nr:septation protein SepH [Amycolatopsis sp. GM8]